MQRYQVVPEFCLITSSEEKHLPLAMVQGTTRILSKIIEMHSRLNTMDIEVLSSGLSQINAAQEVSVSISPHLGKL